MDSPNVSQAHKKYDMHRNGALLVVTNIIKIEGENCRNNIMNGNSELKELEDNSLPNVGFNGTMDEQMGRKIDCE